LAVFLFVRLGGELEGRVEIGFGDFVVVIEKSFGFGHCVRVVGLRGELVSVLHGVLVYDAYRSHEKWIYPS
jgi:hypothetical protein